MPRISYAQLYNHPQVNVITTQPTDALPCGFYKVISEAGCYGGFYCIWPNWFGAKSVISWAGCGTSVDENGDLIIPLVQNPIWDYLNKDTQVGRTQEAWCDVSTYRIKSDAVSVEELDAMAGDLRRRNNNVDVTSQNGVIVVRLATPI